MLTQERLKQLLHYNPETGVFTWLVKRRRVNAGDVAGGENPDGYHDIGVDQKLYRAHRLAWLYVYGVWPVSQIDHRSGIRNENRIDNLREANQAQNKQNQHKARSNSKTGVLGVGKINAKWRAIIGVNGRQIHLGMYDTPELAHAAYLSAKRELHPFSEI